MRAIGLGFVVLLAGCDGLEDLEAEPSIEVTMTLSDDPKDEKNGKITFDEASCKIDPDTSSGKVRLTSKESKADLIILLKSVNSKGSELTCAQAGDNTKKGEVGMKYDECGVILKVPSELDDMFDTYASFREDKKIASFAYDGECSVKIESASKKNVVGSVDCKGLKQTHYEDSMVNPITDATPTISVSGDFKCEP